MKTATPLDSATRGDDWKVRPPSRNKMAAAYSSKLRFFLGSQRTYEEAEMCCVPYPQDTERPKSITPAEDHPKDLFLFNTFCFADFSPLQGFFKRTSTLRKKENL